MFKRNSQGYKEFIHGKESETKAITACKACESFIPDDEDEQVSENLYSCYNCLYRKWTMHSFVCLKSRVC